MLDKREQLDDELDGGCLWWQVQLAPGVHEHIERVVERVGRAAVAHAQRAMICVEGALATRHTAVLDAARGAHAMFIFVRRAALFGERQAESR